MEEKEILIEIQNEQEKEEREGTESKNLEMLSERERERERVRERVSEREREKGEIEGRDFYYCQIFLPEGSGPILEVLQYQANPWRERSKPLTSHL